MLFHLHAVCTPANTGLAIDLAIDLAIGLVIGLSMPQSVSGTIQPP